MDEGTAAAVLAAIRAAGTYDFCVPLSAVSPLRCIEVLRSLPGKRLTCLARWGEHTVIAKIYLDQARGEVHWRRELLGANALNDAGVPSPRVLWSGESELDSVYVVIYQWLDHGDAMGRLWETSDDSQRRVYLKQLQGTLASHHLAGLTQQDLHLDNFFYRQGVVYTLDGADISVAAAPLRKSRAADNLARFWAQLSPRFDSWLESLLPEYMAHNPAIQGNYWLPWIEQRIQHWRKRRRDQFLKKIFRRCSQFECFREQTRYTVFDRRYDTPAFRQLLADPDEFIVQGQLLKSGNTCTVVRVRLDGLDLVIKRYNLKNRRHALGRSYRRSRAAVSWKNAFRLQFYGIATPRPAALVEERWGRVRRRAFFITEYEEGQSCQDFLMACEGESERQRFLNALMKILAQLRQQRISHGDFKATNILVHKGDPRIIDLDVMKEHNCGYLFERAWQRDMLRLCRNWPASSSFRRQLERRLRFLKGA